MKKFKQHNLIRLRIVHYKDKVWTLTLCKKCGRFLRLYPDGTITRNRNDATINIKYCKK